MTGSLSVDDKFWGCNDVTCPADDADSGAELIAGRTRVSLEDILTDDAFFEQLAPRHNFADVPLSKAHIWPIIWINLGTLQDRM